MEQGAVRLRGQPPSANRARNKEAALLVPDPVERPRYPRDPNDDYPIAAAKVADVPLVVSGDRDLPAFSEPSPIVLTPAAFLDALKARPD